MVSDLVGEYLFSLYTALPPIAALRAENRDSIYNGRNKKVVVSIDFADSSSSPPKNYKHPQYMNGYSGGYYNIIVTQYEPDSLAKYLKDNEVVYDKKEMNGRYQVGSGRIVTVTHDTPFIENIVAEKQPGVKQVSRSMSDMDDIGPVSEAIGKNAGDEGGFGDRRNRCSEAPVEYLGAKVDSNGRVKWD